MKKMLLIVALFAATMSYGQKKATKTSYSIGAQVCMPTGKTADAFKSGVGATVAATYHVNKKTDFVYRVGYVSHQPKVGTENLVQVPLTIGADYKVCSVAKVGGEAGASIFNRSMGTWFTFSPVVTYSIKKFDVAARYTVALQNKPDMTDFTNASLTVSYNF